MSVGGNANFPQPLLEIVRRGDGAKAGDAPRPPHAFGSGGQIHFRARMDKKRHGITGFVGIRGVDHPMGCTAK